MQLPQRLELNGALLDKSLEYCSIFSIKSSLKRPVSSTIQTPSFSSVSLPSSSGSRPFHFLLIFSRHCSLEIKNCIPDPVRHVRATSSTQSHPFQATLPNPRTLVHKSYFIPRTSQLWNTLPSTAFPKSYSLSPLQI